MAVPYNDWFSKAHEYQEPGFWGFLCWWGRHDLREEVLVDEPRCESKNYYCKRCSHSYGITSFGPFNFSFS